MTNPRHCVGGWSLRAVASGRCLVDDLAKAADDGQQLGVGDCAVVTNTYVAELQRRVRFVVDTAGFCNQVVPRVSVVAASQYSCTVLEVPALLMLPAVGLGRAHNPIRLPHQWESLTCCLTRFLEQLTTELTLFACFDLCPDGGLFFGDRQWDANFCSPLVNARTKAHHLLIRCHTDPVSLKLLVGADGVFGTLCRSTT